MRTVLIAAFALIGCATAPSANETRSYAERCEFISFATTEGGFNDAKDWDQKTDALVTWRDPYPIDWRCVPRSLQRGRQEFFSSYGISADRRFASVEITTLTGNRKLIGSITACYFERAEESWREISCNTYTPF